MSERDPFSLYRERLETVGFRPSRRLGQNFLLQPELHRLIADAAEVTRDDIVLEIGAGLGFLTRELAPRAHRVIAVEIDHRLYELLAEELPRLPDGDRVRLVRSDILAGGGRLATAVCEALAEAGAGRPLRVVANLPYAITGPVLATLCTGQALPASMAILIQREVAEHLASRPGDAAWGSLSGVLQACYQVRLVRHVGREVFRPRPNVDSTIVALTRRTDGLATGDCAARTSFAAFVRALFGARRKKIRHRIEAATLAAGLPAGASVVSAAVLDARPGELDVAALIALWQCLAARS